MMSNLTHQSSLHQNVTREITSLFHNFLTIANLIYLFGRNQYLRYVTTKVAVFNISFKVFLYLSFFSANSTQNVPFLFNLRHFSLLLMWINKFHQMLETEVHRKYYHCN